MEWISVKDGLPEVGKIVVWYSPFAHTGTVKGYVADYLNELDKKEHNINWFKKFTHWMPLPDPPLK